MLVGNVNLLAKVATVFVSSSKMDSVLGRISNMDCITYIAFN